MADLKADFEQAAVRVKSLSDDPGNDTKLRLYSLYKQGAEGDVKGEKPGFFDFVGAAKYEAWSKLKGMKAEEAMKKYVALVDDLAGGGKKASKPAASTGKAPAAKTAPNKSKK